MFQVSNLIDMSAQTSMDAATVIANEHATINWSPGRPFKKNQVVKQSWSETTRLPAEE